MKIGNFKISQDNNLFKIAEISANHGGSLQRAKDTILAAKKSGADAVKFQTYTPDTLTIDCGNEEFILKGGTWDGYKLYDLYKEAHTPYEWHKDLFNFASEIGILSFSTPFDSTAVNLLESLNTPAYKVASFELIDIPLLKEIAKTKKPVFMSTGASNLSEISEALETLRAGGTKDIVLFHCISSYPATLEDSNLLSIPFLREHFKVEVGLSDHTIGNNAGVIAACLGAVAIEKHFITDRKKISPDSSFSCEPNEFKSLSNDLDIAKQALGKFDLVRSKSELQSMDIRKSIYFVQNLKPGHQITEDDIKIIRPGFGLHPRYKEKIIGKKINKEVKFGDPVKKEFIDW